MNVKRGHNKAISEKYTYPFKHFHKLSLYKELYHCYNFVSKLSRSIQPFLWHRETDENDEKSLGTEVFGIKRNCFCLVPYLFFTSVILVLCSLDQKSNEVISPYQQYQPC